MTASLDKTHTALPRLANMYAFWANRRGICLLLVISNPANVSGASRLTRRYGGLLVSKDKIANLCAAHNQHTRESISSKHVTQLQQQIPESPAAVPLTSILMTCLWWSLRALYLHGMPSESYRRSVTQVSVVLVYFER